VHSLSAFDAIGLPVAWGLKLAKGQSCESNRIMAAEKDVLDLNKTITHASTIVDHDNIGTCDLFILEVQLFMCAIVSDMVCELCKQRRHCAAVILYFPFNSHSCYPTSWVCDDLGTTVSQSQLPKHILRPLEKSISNEKYRTHRNSSCALPFTA
jgi:hypothetical protein